ncbi:hypothetical protein SAMN05216249_10969 [Acetitomaculum ruminis DSM 5522]|uniref:Uncharacterized protein n=1 Tax=Acetitomaculum ruminis DSM 5522 TaxID=1120918 RepID=A0A1I0YAW1_9FIRM|nr:hypothetical protein [Acetitomaculum ruminis]SFB10332.1 hypothetical protein SAMN05216249_10969 [Acetitomaculum ruminis DSM 5522]
MMKEQGVYNGQANITVEMKEKGGKIVGEIHVDQLLLGTLEENVANSLIDELELTIFGE